MPPLPAAPGGNPEASARTTFPDVLDTPMTEATANPPMSAARRPSDVESRPVPPQRLRPFFRPLWPENSTVGIHCPSNAIPNLPPSARPITMPMPVLPASSPPQYGADTDAERHSESEVGTEALHAGNSARGLERFLGTSMPGGLFYAPSMRQRIPANPRKSPEMLVILANAWRMKMSKIGDS